ncbi:MAG: hypothetical protein AAGD11_13345 [Planctomycetota bacterium]
MVHLLLLTTMALGSGVASSQSVEWQADYGKALAATRADDRPLLIVLDVPADEKKAVEDDQLKGEGEQAELLANYQLCHIDASTEYGERVAKVFKADKFPFTAIIDKTGSVILLKKQGQLTDAEWNETLTSYKSGERSATRYTSAYRGSTIPSSGSFSYPSSGSTVVSPSYCPSCQRNAQRSF